MAIKPILFNTEMVRAILDGRKACTRRILKGAIPFDEKAEYWNVLKKGEWSGPICVEYFMKQGSPYKPGDILYVRETWEHFECCCCEGDEHGNCYREPQQSVLNKSYGCYMYRATDEIYGDARWHPSIHMPKEAARIWLRVTNVKVERLQEITPQGAWKEGARCSCLHPVPDCAGNKTAFVNIWNSTIKKSDIDRYGWDANPWVWVIEFECEKPRKAAGKAEAKLKELRGSNE